MKNNKICTRSWQGKGLQLWLAISFLGPVIAAPQEGKMKVEPVLEYPAPGLDDIITYRGYTTRFFKDSKGNTLQISLNSKNGRVLHLWADGFNESIAFTARNATDKPAELNWLSPTALVYSNDLNRYVEYTLQSSSSQLELGHFVLASMRKERDFQYLRHHLRPFDAEQFIEDELHELVDYLGKLPGQIRETHLNLLKANGTAEVASRLIPTLTLVNEGHIVSAHVKQVSFDAKNFQSIELSSDNSNIKIVKNTVVLHSPAGDPIQLKIKIAADAPALHPIPSKGILNQDFFRFYQRVKSKPDSIFSHPGAPGPYLTNKDVYRFKSLERQVKSLGLMSSQEKFLAGVPNYATYFGRDMIMSTLMLEPVLMPEMLEHVISSVLKKLSPAGDVSHEEGLGGQAIKENAAQYNALLADYFQMQDKLAAAQLLRQAENVLANLQKTTENYRMVDDDFQFPVLVALYLSGSDVTDKHKRDFLLSSLSAGNPDSRLTLLLRNLDFVINKAQAYVETPSVQKLISFQKIEGNGWHAGSWRDSRVGYANGRFAMDVNVIWVPKALESIEKIVSVFSNIGITTKALVTAWPEIQNTKLINYMSNPNILKNAITTWHGAIKHFEIQLSASEVKHRISSKLAWFPEPEKNYWSTLLEKTAATEHAIEFLAISLDEKGQPIAVANTDMATWLFLENLSVKILDGEIKADEVLNRIKIFDIPYPVGLYIKGVGPVATNDAFASREVWESFKSDIYHSPLTIWGREVNLFLLGLSKQIASSYDTDGKIKDPDLIPFVRELRTILDKTLSAVESSGLKYNELWSYRIEGKKLFPARYATTSDIQLWNLTDLAVQYLLDHISALQY